MQDHLSIERCDSLGYGQAKLPEDFLCLTLQVEVYACMVAIGFPQSVPFR